MDNKDEGMHMKTDTRNLARGKMEGFKTTKPIVMLKYPESIHFSITCMIRGTDLADWDDIWYVSNQIDKHVCYKLDTFCNIKEDFSITKLENQMKFLFTYGIGEVLIEDGGQGFIVPRVHYAPEKDEGLEQDLVRIKGNLYSTKVQTFNEFVAFLNLIKHDDVVNQEWDFFRNMFNKIVKWFYNYYLDRSLPGPIPPIINGVHIHLFDLYKLIEGLGGYLSVYFCQEFDTIGEIIGLLRGNGEEIKKCYINYLDVITSHFKTARAPQQGCKNTLVESAWKAEDKDIDCLEPHQWDFGDNGAPMTRPAVLEEKKTLEHFGVKLEDT
nr:ARID DNA-binding domain-containing protein [Tanacetum cinerariifolium]